LRLAITLFLELNKFRDQKDEFIVFLRVFLQLLKTRLDFFGIVMQGKVVAKTHLGIQNRECMNFLVEISKKFENFKITHFLFFFDDPLKPQRY